MTSMGLGRVIDSYDIDLAKKSEDLYWFKILTKLI